jgi:hypothetical protein
MPAFDSGAFSDAFSVDTSVTPPVSPSVGPQRSSSPANKGGDVYTKSAQRQANPEETLSLVNDYYERWRHSGS